MNSQINFRKAVWEDAELLFSWANDMDVRRNAFTQHEISWDEHAQWFQKKLSDEDCCIYIAYQNRIGGMAERLRERPIGQIRLDIDGDKAEIDYSVCAEMRGHGLGTILIKEIQSLAEERIQKFTAKVKKSNPASIKVFEKCGFVKTEEKETYVELEKKREPVSKEKKAFVICTRKSWNIKWAERLRWEYEGIYDVMVITEKEMLRPEVLEKIRPEYIFFPHWSYIIPKEIFKAYPCVVFHMTDLPFGRGGSPLQNLIVRGFKKTKLSAISVDEGLDTGAVYCKEDLDLSGNADEILRRASDIIFTRMIPYLLKEHPKPIPQSGEAVVFKRRKPEDGKLLSEMEAETIYDYIRMLDGEGYPSAFLEFGDYVLRFSKAAFADGKVTANVTFEKKEESEKTENKPEDGK